MDQAARPLAAAAAVLLLLCGCEGKPQELEEYRIPGGLAERFYPPPGWTWGTLQVEGAPPLRYGVAAPPHAARAEVLILPGAGEPAEAWFETAGELLARDYTVWVVDWAGQGGSGRWRGAPDRLYARSLDPDVAALTRMVTEVVRPRTRAPLVLLAEGLGAQLALRALSEGPIDAAGAVLVSPSLEDRPLKLSPPFGEEGGRLVEAFGLGRTLVAGAETWRAPENRARGREAVAQAWMASNPPLRMGGATLSWTAAYNRSAAAARDPAALARIRTSVLMYGAEAACRTLPDCRAAGRSGAPPHLASDDVRRPWLAEVIGFVEDRARGHAVAAAPVR